MNGWSVVAPRHSKYASLRKAMTALFSEGIETCETEGNIPFYYHKRTKTSFYKLDDDMALILEKDAMGNIGYEPGVIREILSHLIADYEAVLLGRANSGQRSAPEPEPEEGQASWAADAMRRRQARAVENQARMRAARAAADAGEELDAVREGDGEVAARIWWTAGNQEEVESMEEMVEKIVDLEHKTSKTKEEMTELMDRTDYFNGTLKKAAEAAHVRRQASGRPRSVAGEEDSEVAAGAWWAAGNQEEEESMEQMVEKIVDLEHKTSKTKEEMAELMDRTDYFNETLKKAAAHFREQASGRPRKAEAAGGAADAGERLDAAQIAELRAEEASLTKQLDQLRQDTYESEAKQAAKDEKAAAKVARRTRTAEAAHVKRQAQLRQDTYESEARQAAKDEKAAAKVAKAAAKQAAKDEKAAAKATKAAAKRANASHRGYTAFE